MLYYIDIACQAWACVCGIIAIFLIARRNKWGFVFGLIAQPAWYYTTVFHGQWLIFVLAIVYTINWCYGIYNWFFKEET